MQFKERMLTLARMMRSALALAAASLSPCR